MLDQLSDEQTFGEIPAQNSFDKLSLLEIFTLSVNFIFKIKGYFRKIALHCKNYLNDVSNHIFIKIQQQQINYFFFWIS